MNIRNIFAKYYETADIRIPEIEKREFGIGNNKKIDARHLNFANVSEFRKYLCMNTPMFVSHSTAYYRFPGATPIQKKHWLYADIVFDLDIHAEGKYGVYPLLENMKKDVVRLVEDFIVNDFGIERQHVMIVFSGNRGYHVHVRDPRYMKMGGEERRELVDYIMGQGLNYLDFFPSRETVHSKLMGPRPDEGGYRGRFARKLIKKLEEDPTAISRIFKKDQPRKFFIDGIKEGNYSKTTLKLDDLLNRLSLIAQDLSVGTVNTDVAVTQDLSKLIRVPNSVHGETGLIAKIVDDIEAFSPFEDAGINGENRRIKFIEDVPELEITETKEFRKEDMAELPLHKALFFVLRKSAVWA
ncbi:DNA primase catalytic subunit PriS [Candidatus Micrarchaeota archaeon]|nr:DNA primase catalytic subunit PriS [Candidatus Micrarchaeota archaeon]